MDTFFFFNGTPFNLLGGPFLTFLIQISLICPGSYNRAFCLGHSFGVTVLCLPCVPSTCQCLALLLGFCCLLPVLVHLGLMEFPRTRDFQCQSRESPRQTRTCWSSMPSLAPCLQLPGGRPGASLATPGILVAGFNLPGRTGSCLTFNSLLLAWGHDCRLLAVCELNSTSSAPCSRADLKFPCCPRERSPFRSHPIHLKWTQGTPPPAASSDRHKGG